MSRSLRAVALFAALSIVSLTGCSEKGGPAEGGEQEPKATPCTSSSQCAADQRCDLTTERCAPKCTADNQCPRHTGTRCEEETGECVAAKTCEEDYNCRGGDGYCGDDDAGCYCMPDASVADGIKKGICWRAAKTCEPCLENQECGDDVFNDRPAACRQYRVGGEDQAVCLPQVRNGCPGGMLPANVSTHAGLDGLCVPQSGDCAVNEACRDDADCKDAGLPICDRVRQICIPGCYFDVSAKRTVGCREGLVCNATPEGSDPSLLDRCETATGFGYGRCEPPCLDDDGCKAIDPSFVCRNDGGGSRCRPEGCLFDAECTEAGAPYYGFCDVASGSCVYNACRVGDDPRAACGSGVQYADCEDGYKCVGDGSSGTGLCHRQTCVERGGADVGCALGFFCSGEAYIDPLTLEPTGQVVTLDGVPEGMCAPMDIPAWCGDDCFTPGGDECLGKGPTNYPDSPPACSSHGLDKFSCFWGCEYQADCPARWNCSSRTYELGCAVPIEAAAQFCESNADCTGGSRCVEPTVYGGPVGYPGGKPFKICECTATDAWGPGFSCNAGIATAGIVPGDPTFEKIQARYCTGAGSCGASGSCEFFGSFNYAKEVPEFFCATDQRELTDRVIPCPEEAAFARPGKSINDKRVCVKTSVCQPSYLMDPETNEPQCTYYGAD